VHQPVAKRAALAELHEHAAADDADRDDLVAWRELRRLRRTRLALDAGNAGRGLLRHVGQLVTQQPRARAGLGGVGARREVHVGAVGQRERAVLIGDPRGVGAVMNANPREVDAQPALVALAHVRRQGGAAAPAGRRRRCLPARPATWAERAELHPPPVRQRLGGAIGFLLGTVASDSGRRGRCWRQLAGALVGQIGRHRVVPPLPELREPQAVAARDWLPLR
jgi:hypothetical protein